VSDGDPGPRGPIPAAVGRSVHTGSVTESYPAAYVHQLRRERDQLRAALLQLIEELERATRTARQALSAPPADEDLAGS
jgi:hypothetical protein